MLARRGTTLSIAQQTESARAAATVERMYSTTSGFVLFGSSHRQGLDCAVDDRLWDRTPSAQYRGHQQELYLLAPTSHRSRAVHQYGGSCPARIQGNEYTAHHSAPGVAEQDAVLNLQLIQDLA